MNIVKLLLSGGQSEAHLKSLAPQEIIESIEAFGPIWYVIDSCQARKRPNALQIWSLIHGNGLCFLAETLWLRPDLREKVGSAARLIGKGVVCWPHGNRGLLLAKPIRMFGERR